MPTFQERYEKTSHPLLKKLFKIIIEKQSTLCVAADFGTTEETIDFINKNGKHICILKTHLTTVPIDTNMLEYSKLLYAKKKEFNFLLFEDRKLNELPEIIEQEYFRRHVKYFDLITVMQPLEDTTFDALRRAIKKADLPEDEPRGCLAVCELSYRRNSQEEEYLASADKNSDVCVGIIAQNLQVKDEFKMFKASPGVHLAKSGDGTGQNWNSPIKVVEKGADVIIVGRGITLASKDEQERVACQYKEAAYLAAKQLGKF